MTLCKNITVTQCVNRATRRLCHGLWLDEKSFVASQQPFVAALEERQLGMRYL